MENKKRLSGKAKTQGKAEAVKELQAELDALARAFSDARTVLALRRVMQQQRGEGHAMEKQDMRLANTVRQSIHDTTPGGYHPRPAMPWAVVGILSAELLLVIFAGAAWAVL